MKVNKEKIEEFINNNNKKFYQSIKFEDGVEIKGNYKTYEMFEKIGFPKDFTGKSYLDIGSNLGAFCIEAYKRGCRKCYGIEKNNYHLNKAIELVKILELEDSIVYIKGDLEKMMVAGLRFDVMTMMSILHHLHNPLTTLKKIASMCKDVFIIESVTKPSGKGGVMVSEMKDGIKSFKEYPTEEALRKVLSEYGFKRIDKMEGSKSDNRIVLCCYKEDK